MRKPRCTLIRGRIRVQTSSSINMQTQAQVLSGGAGAASQQVGRRCRKSWHPRRLFGRPVAVFDRCPLDAMFD